MKSPRWFLMVVAALICTFASAPSAWANTTTTVHFRAGGDSASYRGSIRGDETARYLIDARRGQQMRISLRTDNPGANFNFLPPGSREAIFIGSVEGPRFSGTLPATGQYVIEVYLMRAASRRNEGANFTLDIAIPAAAGGSATVAGDYADGNTGGPDRWMVTGVAPNDRLSVRASPSPGGALVGRLRNGDVVRNLGCRSIGNSRWCRVSAPGEGGVHGWANGRFLRETTDRGYVGTGYEEHNTADERVHDVKCQNRPHDCIRKAEQKCNGQFRTLHSESHAGGLLDDKLPGPVTWYHLEYQCGYSDGRRLQFPFRGVHYEREYTPDYDFSGDDSFDRPVNEAGMRNACKQAAAMEFHQHSRHVLVLPVERTGNGFTVYGQYPEAGPDVTTFACSFNRSGEFKRVHRN